MSKTSYLNNKSILLISPEPWGDNFVSKHHYAISLARRGNKIYFLNPPGKRNEIKRIEENLYILNYNPFIKGINYLHSLFRDKFSSIDIAKITKLTSRSGFDIVWSFDPYRFQNLRLFQATIAIYHPVDIHNIKILERQTANSGDIILGSSDQILQKIKTKKPNYKINHGLSIQFANHSFNYKPPSPIIKVGYLGNLHYQYLDKVILQRIIMENPDIEFHFIGPFKISNLSNKYFNEDLIRFIGTQKNCLLYGAKTSNQLPELLDQFHLFLMCYSGDKYLAETANPHKIIEFLSTGKVVVSHYIDEYKDKRQLLEMVEKNEDLPNEFNKVIGNLNYYNSPEKQAIRKAWANDNTYKRQVGRIENILNDLMKN